MSNVDLELVQKLEDKAVEIRKKSVYLYLQNRHRRSFGRRIVHRGRCRCPLLQIHELRSEKIRNGQKETGSF